MPSFKRITGFLLFLVLLSSCSDDIRDKGPKYDYSNMDSRTKELHIKTERFLLKAIADKARFNIHPVSRIDSVIINQTDKRLGFHFSKPFSYSPFREDNVRALYQALRTELDGDYKDYALSISTIGKEIEALIPMFYKSKKEPFNEKISERIPIVRKRDGSNAHTQGLFGNNIALWHSHGWYYNQELDRWMWQRARLFGTVEDLYPASITLPFLIPMLENAGAHVFVPRERDIQINEIIVDNDALPHPNMPASYVEERHTKDNTWQTGPNSGFALGNPPYEVNFNPFKAGSYRQTNSDSLNSSQIRWTPSIPEEGYYAVYISYHHSEKNVTDAHYTVHHSGGSTEFLVNQTMGGGTWIYLGTFKFNKGYNPNQGMVVLSNKSQTLNRIVSADAVKFGGGIGSVMRNGQTSMRPKFVEGARYWLQTAGFPDSLVYNLNDMKSDYKDDYQSRGEWVNYLKGAPFGPNKNRDAKGMGIPIDASLAFHTDAGIATNDTTIGTLQIYSVMAADTTSLFPDGQSRYDNRAFSDIMQSQIVADTRILFNPNWNRRALREAQYSEAYRPNVPATLLELLSHQNFYDMKYGLDPRYKFHISRAIYKAFLRFISAQEMRAYMVQPLPVNHFKVELNRAQNIKLSWKPVNDPLEPKAKPSYYKVYTRMGESGFDNGVIVKEPFLDIQNPEKNTIYSFKVTALNAGGESFPSEILSTFMSESNPKTVLIVNGFNRLAPPGILDEGGYLGFKYGSDDGVTYGKNIGFIGNQFNFRKQDNWISDDRPGHGASYGTVEAAVTAGNSFDYSYEHGKWIAQAGYSFCSVSDEAFADSAFDATQFQLLDFILGEEKETHWQLAEMDKKYGTQFKVLPTEVKRQLKRFTQNGGGLFLSGAYVGTDMFSKGNKEDMDFARTYLHFDWVTDQAAKNGTVFFTKESPLKLANALRFNTQYQPDIYKVEAPDAIKGINGSKTFLRYKENGLSAGVTYDGAYKLVVMGFPFETILEDSQKAQLMKQVLAYLNK